MEKVIVRFAPSPTGFLHIGGLRTALFNWLWARKNKGKFILRIEDTDRERYLKGSVDNIMEALRWYGLDFDEGPVYQSKRLSVYKKFAHLLLEQGKAYYCFCSSKRLEQVRQLQTVNKQAPKYDGHCRTLSAGEVKEKIKKDEPHVIRLKIPSSGQTEFEDTIYGRISVDNNNLDDQVLLKSDGYPTYHLANVIDDYEQGVNCIIRAEEWLPSTPKHIILYKAFGWPLPEFAHLPMVLGADRAKFSKRHGAVSALSYRDLGYLPQAVLNFIALLGWNPKTDKEIFSLGELVKEFDLSKVNKSSAVFNIEKLNWMNGQYIKRMDRDSAINARVHQYYQDKSNNYDISNTIALTGTSALEINRLNTFKDPSEIAVYTLKDVGDYSPDMLIPKGETAESTLKVLMNVKDFIGSVMDEHSYEKVEFLKEDIIKWITEQGLSNKQVLWPLRVALTGKEKSPDVFEMMHYWANYRGIGKVLDLVARAIQSLRKN